MLKKYRNALLETIRETGLDPTLFEATLSQPNGTTTESSFKIHLKGTLLDFTAINKANSYDWFSYEWTAFSPGYAVFGPSDDDLVYFTKLRDYFISWLRDSVQVYLNELKEPDLWSQLENQKALVSAAPPQEQDTSLFSEAEKVQVRLGVQEFRSLVQENFEPQDEEMRVIDARLQYLTEAVDRLNRFDWKALAIATMIGIATTLTLDTQKGAMLLALFQQAMQAVTHFLPG